MSLNVALTNYIDKGVDLSALKDVSREILSKTKAPATDLAQFDLSKFRRIDQGIDLYAGKVDSSVARNISMQNSSMQVQLNQNIMASVQFLNAQASQNIHRAVEGKLTIAVNEDAIKAKSDFELPKFSQLVKTNNVGKDKEGSSNLYNGNFLFLKQQKQQQQQEEKAIDKLA